MVKLLAEECPKCNSDELVAVICEDFVSDGEWAEYKCTDYGHTWQESESDEQ